MFRLRLEKIVERGEKKYKIIGWEGGIPEEKLPLSYLKEGKRFVSYNEHIKIFGYDFSNSLYKNYVYTSWHSSEKYLLININEIYDINLIEKIILMLKECGERLHHIRQEIKKLEQEWQGQVEVII